MVLEEECIGTVTISLQGEATTYKTCWRNMRYHDLRDGRSNPSALKVCTVDNSEEVLGGPGTLGKYTSIPF